MATPEQALQELSRRFRDPDPKATFISPVGYAQAKDCRAVLALLDELPKDAFEGLTDDERSRFTATVAEVRSAATLWESGARDLTLGRLKTPFSERPMTILKTLLTKMSEVSMPRSKRYGKWIPTGASLGSGGQADVHVVYEDGDPEQRPFALKRLRNRDRLERFRKEIGAALSLDHPNIVRVRDYSLEDPAFLVMDIYQNGSLKYEKLEKLSLVNRLEAFLEVCGAFAHAHENGIIHRDVKPDNILVGDDRHLLVSDFGVCFIKDEERATATSEVIRNWMCTAPELEDGRDDRISPAADVYCLGKLLYWMLSGGFFGREKHREERFDLTRVEPRLGHVLVYELLDQMIVGDPRARIQSASELLEPLKVLIGRVRMKAHAVDLEAPQPCDFCGVGEYQIHVDPRHEKEKVGSEIFRLGINFHGDSPLLVFVCDYCGHMRFFKPTLAVKGYRGNFGNWTPLKDRKT